LLLGAATSSIKLRIMVSRRRPVTSTSSRRTALSTSGDDGGATVSGVWLGVDASIAARAKANTSNTFPYLRYTTLTALF